MMTRHRSLTIALALLLVAAMGAPPLVARSKVEWQTYSLAQLKTAMGTLGVGEHAKVIVTLEDGTKLTGHVTQTDDTHFVVVVGGRATPVEYDQVADIRAGNPDTQVKFAARIATDAAALAASSPSTKQGHPRLTAASKTIVVLAVTAGGIVLSLALLGKL
ncbi:MAG TPA: hypothetical protein VG860_24085 [Terriglobia bacterium]|jgi:hypothetical protein|nr:hypothetical protein [Terriglobia bacterium]